MDNTHQFDHKSKIYAQARPPYAAALFKYLDTRFQPKREKLVVADVGAGTGIFTSQLLEAGWRVEAVEPNADMRHFLQQQVGQKTNCQVIAGSDQDTKLAAHSVDLVTVAQAFHWFDPVAFKKECQRILKPQGYVIIVYNSHFQDTHTDQLIKILRQYCPRFHGFSNRLQEKDFAAFFGNNFQTLKFKNSQPYSHDKYVGRVLSSSYALTPHEARYQEFVQALNRLADQIDQEGLVNLSLVTTAYIGKV